MRGAGNTPLSAIYRGSTMKNFREFVKDQKKTSQEKQRESAIQTNDATASDSIIQSGLEQSYQIASFRKTEET